MGYADGYQKKLDQCLQGHTNYDGKLEKFNECTDKCDQDSYQQKLSQEELDDCWNECTEGLKVPVPGKPEDCIKVSKHHDCHEWCEEEYDELTWRSICKVDCNEKCEPFGDTNNTSEDISIMHPFV